MSYCPYIELFVPLYDTLKEMKDQCLKGAIGQSLSSNLVTKFEFISALFIAHNVLDRLLPVTLLLQGKSIDIMIVFI
jgi:hypothetical protein